MKRSMAAVIGLALLALLALAAVLAPFVAPHAPTAINLDAALCVPGAGHLLGCDELGRDVWSRLLWGSRASMAVGICAVLVSMTIGVLVGAVAGYAGGVVDAIVMRGIDILLAFPGILLAIAVAGVLGPSFVNVIIALSVLGWVGYARLVRGQVLSIRERDFVLSARSIGASPWRIVWRHVLPEVAAPVVVQATFGVAGAILAEASLSFLGLGPQDVPTWGAMLAEGLDYLLTAPNLSVWPGLAVLVTVLAFNIAGDGLRDALDVKAA
ncbi:MAG: ABC transporter permease [Deltaproteobacteria bacterium]|nr:ABC transporter permease [Deltaproteobacteria bacterium]